MERVYHVIKELPTGIKTIQPERGGRIRVKISRSSSIRSNNSRSEQTKKKYIMEANTIYQKINVARQRIAAMQLSKDGKNAFAQYDYFTPELVQKMVDKGIEGLDIFIKFDTERDTNGQPFCTLGIISADNIGSQIVFTYITEVPDVKATNAAQRYGALQTYAKRYMLMNAFNITDNTLDFDAQTDKRKDMSKATFDKIMTQLTTPDAKKKALEFIKQYKDSELTTKIIEACQK